MRMLKREELELLAKERNQPSVSIYMPTRRRNQDNRGDVIQFKNLLTKAEDELAASSSFQGSAAKLLEPARGLLDDSSFWSYLSHGLAVFIADGFFRYYQCPVHFPEVVMVGERFHLKPLMPLFSEDRRFFILALSQNSVRLFQATDTGVEAVEVEDLPQSLDEALRYDEPEKQLQFHTGTQKAPGKRAAVFHGQGVGTDETKENIFRFCRQVNDSLQELLHRENAPLILAGVEYVTAIYREANTYDKLLQETVKGNPDEAKGKELSKKAWPLVEPHFKKEQKETAERYWDLVGTGLSSADLKAVVPAAYFGRVESLYAAAGVQQWGTFDESDGSVEIHDEWKPGDEDLLDFAAVNTLTKGGKVYVVEREEIPHGDLVAAVFRY